MTTISLAMIVRDEQANLQRALSSASPWVDEIIVLDTGSEDSTPAIAKQNGAKVYHHVWNGFSASRNESLRMCSSDWIFVLDADEELDSSCGKFLREIIEPDSLTGVVCRQRNYFPNSPFVDVPVVRLFMNDERIRFSGLLHERIRCDSPEYKRITGNILIHHYGASASYDPASSKGKKYEDILRQGISREVFSPEDLLFLGIHLRRKQAFSEAIEVLQRCIAESLSTASYLPSLYETLAVCFYECGRFSEAARTCSLGLRCAPEFPPLLYNLALCHWKSGRFKDGRRLARAAKSAAENYSGHIPIDPEIRLHLAERLYRACHGT